MTIRSILQVFHALLCPQGMGVGIQLAMNGGDIKSVDWADVAISAAVSAIAPGGFSAGRKIYRSIKAGKTIKNQLQRVKAVSRYQKLQGRLNSHNRIVRNQLAIQGVWQGGKFIAKKAINYPANTNQGK